MNLFGVVRGGFSFISDIPSMFISVRAAPLEFAVVLLYSLCFHHPCMPAKRTIAIDRQRSEYYPL